ncbi:centromere protein H (CENP-H)-domain-containing protein [Hyaloscypha finlandica]|nr:centromere protein H (CENP-H)-domain-containing protein [Hyaloscypha finlandica]KAH8802078.1 centromere protein H (CENP-H)-domain-containing protein [Hyaloscypha sp. PMI_1271]
MSRSLVEEMEGVELTGMEKQSPPLLTEDEKRILDVYDRLEELQLDIAHLKALGVLSQDEPLEVSQEDLTTARQELLTAKAAYQVRNKVIESVLIANPILKAVHGGKNATIAEQDLTPLIQQRDDLSITLIELSTRVLSTRNELKNVESEHMVTARKNAELATMMLALAEEADTKRKEDIDDPKARQQLDELEVKMKTGRQRWRIMKETASATIAGSGIDWARDPKLLEIVLDNDGNER